jgi:hypothetical protein
VTAVVHVPPRTFVAPRRSRRLAIATFIYVAAAGAVTFVRSGSPDYIGRAGEAAAAFGMVVPLFCATVAFVIFAVRLAALGVDDGGVSWGIGFFAFRMRAAAVVGCRIYRDAVAVTRRGRRFTWYVCARDYSPFPEVVAAFRRTRLPLEEDGGPAPLAARLQSYGLAVDLLLLLDAVAVSLAFLFL